MKKANAYALVAVAAAYSGLIVRYSLFSGRLSVPPFYDDVFYLNDAAHRLFVLGTEGLWSFLGGLVSTPPHSPYSVAVAFAAFAFFGLKSWAPYLFNGFMIAVLLRFLHQILAPLPGPERWLLSAYVLSLPFVVSGVSEFRPDFACGTLVAVGTFMTLMDVPDTREVTGRVPICVGLALGGALLIKPTFVLYTVALFLVAGVLATILGIRGGTHSRASIGRIWLLVCVVAGAVALPYYVVNWRHVFGYIYRNLFGTGVPIFHLDLSLAEHLSFYLFGRAGTTMLASNVWPLLAATFLGPLLVLFLRPGGRKHVRLVAYWCVILLAWVVPTATTLKWLFGGMALYVMLVLVAGSCAAALLPLVQARVGRTVTITIVVLACVGGLLAFRWPFYTGTPSAPDVSARNEIFDSIQETIGERTIASDQRILLTATGRIVNGPSLEFARLQHGQVIRVFDLSLSDDLAAWVNAIDQANMVVAFEEEFPWLLDTMISAAVRTDVLQVLSRRRDLLRIQTYHAPNGKRAFIFEKRKPLFGVALQAGFGSAETFLVGANSERGIWGRGRESHVRLLGEAAFEGTLYLRAAPRPGVEAIEVWRANRRVGRVEFAPGAGMTVVRLPLTVWNGDRLVTFRYVTTDQSDGPPQQAAFFTQIQAIPRRSPDDR